jgi:hypothetical protein
MTDAETRTTMGRDSGATPAWSMLFLAVILTGATALPVGNLRGLITLPIALVLPGYAIVAAFFGPAMFRLHLIATAVISSIAFYALAPLALNALSLRLTENHVALAVDALVLTSLIVVVTRFGITSPLLQQETKLRVRHLARPFVVVTAGATILLVALFAAREFPQSTRLTYTAVALDRIVVSPLSRKDGLELARAKVELQNNSTHVVLYRLLPAVGRTRWQVRVVRLGPGQRWSQWLSGLIRPTTCTKRLVIKLIDLRKQQQLTALAAPLDQYLARCRVAKAGS